MSYPWNGANFFTCDQNLISYGQKTQIQFLLWLLGSFLNFLSLFSIPTHCIHSRGYFYVKYFVLGILGYGD